MKLKQNSIRKKIKKKKTNKQSTIKRMRTEFNIKIKWNQIMRGKIEEKNQSKKDKKQNK
jgi:hypothetical protein